MAYTPRLKEEYKSRVISALKEEFGYTNVMQVRTPLEVWLKNCLWAGRLLGLETRPRDLLAPLRP